MFGWKRWRAKVKRREEIHAMFNYAVSLLPGFKKSKEEFVLRLPIPLELTDSPMYMEVISGWAYYRLRILYDVSQTDVKQGVLVTQCTYSTIYSDSLTEPDDPREMDLLNAAMRLLQEMIRIAQNEKEEKEAATERMRQKIIANLAYGSLTEGSVLGALKE
jgi:hypothetical protein